MKDEEIEAGSVLSYATPLRCFYWILSKTSQGAEFKYIDRYDDQVHHKFYHFSEIIPFMKDAKLYACPKHMVPFKSIVNE